MDTNRQRETYLGGVPQPPKIPLFGNAFSVDRRAPFQGFAKLLRQYGSIVRLDVVGKPILIVSDPELVRELCDQERFDKSLNGALGVVSRLTGDGLFTAATDQPNWRKAHNILLPNFSRRAIQSYHPMMLDIAGQLVSKWERLNADDTIDVVHDMTCVTLDTIGLCGFGYRFNYLYRDRFHPFIDAMISALDAAMKTRGLPGEDVIFYRRNRRVQNSIRVMNEMVDQIVKERKSDSDAKTKPDLLSFMLSVADKRSGERLDDLNVRYQVITFLIAGHETTSGLLSFAVHALLNHPDVLAKCYEEVDRVLGGNRETPPTHAQIQRLVYVSQVLKETLRLWPTAPAFAVGPRRDTVIGGRYFLKKGQHVGILLSMLHRDEAIWGQRAEMFDPDNFKPEAERARPAHCYKPFGNGQRTCIGQQFAMHEASLVLAMILQRFRLVAHSSCNLKIKETLTIKPDALTIKVRLRDDTIRVRPVIEPAEGAPVTDTLPTPGSHRTPLLVLYGSNMGTAEETARRIAADGQSAGFTVTVAPLDDYPGRLSADGLVVIVSASYNGNPPDNAAEFCRWLSNGGLQPDALRGVRYCVFGCGHRDWATTFQAIPRYIDDRLTAYGARRIYARGEGDARDDFDGQFQTWYESFWRDIAQEFALALEERGTERKKPLFSVEILEPQRAGSIASLLGSQTMRIAVNREQQNQGGLAKLERSTRHIEIDLPPDVGYRAGDHFGVFPRNDPLLVSQIASHFGFTSETRVRLHRSNGRQAFLPTDEPISITRLLREHVELQDPATRSQVKTLAEHARCPHTRTSLLAWSSDDSEGNATYQTAILTPRKSVFDLLKAFPACALPFHIYLEMLPPLAPRYYSISSSPLVSPRRCSITVAVLDAPTRSGIGMYQGVCSNYLARQREGEAIRGFVKDTKSTFRLPENPMVPLIMIGAGTGLAPFRGFLQERLALKLSGQRLAPTMLFFGCRHPARDFLYRNELQEFEAQGITELHTAFSRVEDQPKTYVQHHILTAQERVWALIEGGATIYVCGDASRLAPDVRQTLTTIFKLKTGAGTEGAEEWLAKLTAANRYLVDVWPSN